MPSLIVASGQRVTLLRLLATSACLSACGTAQIYDTNVRLNYDIAQQPATIRVSDPKLFQRHALINERHTEMAYLNKLLTESETISFTPDLARDIETITSLSFALGLSFDGAIKQNARNTAETNDLNQQIAVENLRGKLVQLQRDVELLKTQLATQTAPSATTVSSTVAAATTLTPPAINDLKTTATNLAAQITALTTQLDRVTTAPRIAGVSSSPRDLFQDRQAYRRELQANINAVSLDALHDIGANSLFRLQFQATVMPGEANAALGVLEMSIDRPSFRREQLDKELRALYFQWLDYATTRLNTLTQDGMVRSDPGLLQLGLEGRALSVITINTGIALTPATVNSDSAATNPTQPGTQTAGSQPSANSYGAVTFSNKQTVAKKPIKRAPVMAMPSLTIGPTLFSLTIEGIPKPALKVPQSKAEKANPPPEQEAVCQFGLVVNNAAQQQENCQLLKIAYPATFDTASAMRLTSDVDSIDRAKQEALLNSIMALRPAMARAPNQLSEQMCADLVEKFRPFRETLLDHPDPLRWLQRAYSWTYLTSGGIDATGGERGAKMSASIGERVKLAERTVALAKEMGCQLRPQQIASDDIVPPAFIEALFSPPAIPGQNWSARGRLAIYAVTPVALVQRVSTAARAADAIQIAASLTAALPVQGIGASAGAGYMRSVTGKVDALERIPLVVGYSSPALFDSTSIERHEVEPPKAGWLLGPQVVVDSEKKALALEHNLSPYDLTTDVSIPGWWPQITLISQAAWAPNWRTDRGAMLAQGYSAKRINTVPIRHTPADLDGVTQMLLSETQNSGDGGGIGLRTPVALVASVEPSTVSDCAGATAFVVKGNNLWRASSAFLSGVPATAMDVMPDMAGTIITFDISKLQPGTGEATLIIPTPEGEATAKIQVSGDRTATANCGAVAPDDGTPKITTVLPEVVYACDAAPRIFVRGRNLGTFISARLGNLEVDLINGTATKKGMELQLKAPIGNSGGSQAKLPLVVSMENGVAIANVGIERDDCAKGPSQRGTGLTLISGALDACAPGATVALTGASVRNIQSARLVSRLPKFDLQAKSVKFNEVSQTTELEFVGLPKSSIIGPDALASPVQLILSDRSRSETAINVPAVCGAYTEAKK